MQTSQATEEILRAIEDMTNSANEQGIESEKDTSRIGAMGELIGTVTSMTENMAFLSEQANDLSNQGLEVVETLVEKAKESAKASDEDRKLAEESGKATSNICELIQDIQESSKLAVESMNKAQEIVQTQDVAIRQTEET